MRGNIVAFSVKAKRKALNGIAYYPLGFYFGIGLIVIAGFLYWAQVDLGWQFDWQQLKRWIANNLMGILIVFSAILGLILIASAIAYKKVVDLTEEDYNLWLHQKATRVLFPIFTPLHDWIRIRSRLYHWWHAQTFSNIAHFFILVLAIIGLGKTTAGYISSAQASHGCSDTVTITANTTWSTNQCHGDVVIRNNATLTINGGITADLSSLSVGSDSPAENGNITVKGDTLNNLGVVINVDGTVYVRSGSTINGDGQGYIGGRPGDVSGKGPGGGVADGTNYPGGGGYGGYGGNGGTVSNVGGTPYGSITEPDDLGSGGGFATSCCSNNGGDGGGAVKINAPSSTVTVDGTISVNGTIGGQGCCAIAGSGSGGSVWIIADTLAGTGTVRANGGGGTGANGSGGRIQLTFNTNSSSLTRQAFDGGQSGLSRGAAGTISTSTELVIANNTAVTSIPVATTPLSGTTTYANTTFKDYVNVTIASGANYSGGTTLIQNNVKTTLLADSTIWTGGSLTIQTGTNTINIPKNITNEPEFTSITAGTGTLQHDSHTTTHTYSLILKSTGAVSISGTINVDGKGYIGGRSGDVNGKGPGGAITDGTTNAGGGGYGGNGGNGSGSNTGGSAYGSISQPVDLGSGGGFVTSCCSNSGGDGGGAVKINAPTASVTISGTISANGTIGGQGCCSIAGSGSGGSVWIIADTLAGAGTVRANAGANGTGASGSGGRIQLTYATDSSTLTKQAFDGGQSGVSRGAAGTISTSGGLTIANSTAISTLPSATTPISGTLTYSSTTIKNNVNVTFTSGTNYSGGTTSIENNTKTTLLNSNVVWSGSALTFQTGTNIINVPKTITTKPLFSTINFTSGTTKHDANTTTDLYHLILSATGNITVDSSIDLNSLGFGGGDADATGNGTGPGVGSANNHGGGGAHGGNGGAGSSGGGAGGTAYGSAIEPVTIGSGGGGAQGISGGSGGGAIFLSSGGTIAVNASIIATGGNGGIGCCSYFYGSGGGGGGSIFLVADTISGTAAINANGGNGGNTSLGGCGGGGRIARHYRVLSYSGSATANKGNGSCGTGENGSNQNVGAVTDLVVTGISSPRTAGTTSSVTVEARDGSNNRNFSYTKTIVFTSSDSQADLPANYAFTITNAGQATISGVVLKTAGTQSVTVDQSDDGAVDGSQSNIVVNPGAASTLTVSGIDDPISAGTADSAVVTAKDAYNNTATGYTGTITFSSSDPQATYPANYTFVGGDAGTKTFTNGVTLKTAGEQSITATDTITGSITGSQSAITVNAGAIDSFTVTGIITPTSAGTSHSPTVTAKDSFSNTITSYAGTIAFSSSDSAASLPTNYTFVGGDAGSKTFTNGLTFKTSGTHSVIVTDGTKNGNANGIVVSSGAASKLKVSNVTTPTNVGDKNSATVTVQDEFTNTVTGYTGTIRFSSSDSAASLPANYSFGASDQGIHVFSNLLTFNTAGTQSLTATDISNSSTTGTLTGILVVATATTPPSSEPTVTIPQLTVIFTEPSTGTFTGTIEQLVNGVLLDVVITGTIKGNTVTGTVSGTYGSEPVTGSISGTVKGKNIDSALVTLVGTENSQVNLSVIVSGVISAPTQPIADQPCKLRGTLDMTIDGKKFSGEVQLTVANDGTVSGSAKGFLDNKRVFGRFTATRIQGEIVAGQVTLTESGKEDTTTGEIVGEVNDGEIVLSNAQHCNFPADVDVDTDGDGTSDGNGTGSVVIDNPVTGSDEIDGGVNVTIENSDTKVDTVMNGTFETLVANIVVKPSGLDMTTVEQNELISDALVVVSGIATLSAIPALQNIVLTSSTRGVAFFHWFFFGYIPRKKRKYWGTVKDRSTSAPIAAVLVKLLHRQTGEISRAMRTDQTGRYGFLVDQPGEYQIHIKDPLYDEFTKDNVAINSLTDPIITGDIVLDPIADKRARLLSKAQYYLAGIKVLNLIHWPLLIVGTVLSAWLVIETPTLLRTLVAALYGILWMAKFIGYKRERHYGLVTDSHGNPISRAVIQLTTKTDDVTAHIHSTVTDKYGRFVLLIKPGVYEIIVAKEGFKARHGAVIADEANMVIKLERE